MVPPAASAVTATTAKAMISGLAIGRNSAGTALRFLALRSATVLLNRMKSRRLASAVLGGVETACIAAAMVSRGRSSSSCSGYELAQRPTSSPAATRS